MALNVFFSSDLNVTPAILTVIHDEIFLTTRIRKINSTVKLSHYIRVYL